MRLRVQDYNSSINFQARICFRDLVSLAGNCGEYVTTSGSSWQTKLMVLEPPSSVSGSLMAYLEVWVPNRDEFESAIIGYKVTSL